MNLGEKQTRRPRPAQTKRGRKKPLSGISSRRKMRSSLCYSSLVAHLRTRGFHSFQSPSANEFSEYMIQLGGTGFFTYAHDHTGARCDRIASSAIAQGCALCVADSGDPYQRGRFGLFRLIDDGSAARWGDAYQPQRAE